MLENLLEDCWFRSPGILKDLLSKAGYGICEAISGFVPNTTVAIKLASEAITAFTLLDIERTRQEHNLPNAIHFVLNFSEEEWREVLSGADFHMHLVEQELEKPQWQHLRRAAPCGATKPVPRRQP